MKSFKYETNQILSTRKKMINGLYEQKTIINQKNGVIPKHCEKKANHKVEENICKSLKTLHEGKKTSFKCGHTMTIDSFIQGNIQEPGELAQGLRALSSGSKSVPSSHTRRLTTVCNFIS